MPNLILKQDVLERLSAMKSQVVQVQDGLDSLRYFNIHPAVVNENSRIDEVRLPFGLAAAQTRQDAVCLHQTNTGLRQPNPVAVPKRKLAADEIRIVKDGVKAVRLTVGRILVA